MIEEPVERFVFQFPDEWSVIKYDDCNFYKKRFGNLQDVKAVGLLAIGDDLFMIEATDFRGEDRRISNKEGMEAEKLATELAEKIRDTLAVLYGAHRHESEELKAFSDYLFAGNPRPIKVICLVEEDRPQAHTKSLKPIRSRLLAKIEQKLKYLSVHCKLHTSRDVPDYYGWAVRWEPRAQAEPEINRP